MAGNGGGESMFLAMLEEQDRMETQYKEIEERITLNVPDGEEDRIESESVKRKTKKKNSKFQKEVQKQMAIDLALKKKSQRMKTDKKTGKTIVMTEEEKNEMRKKLKNQRLAAINKELEEHMKMAGNYPSIVNIDYSDINYRNANILKKSLLCFRDVISFQFEREAILERIPKKMRMEWCEKKIKEDLTKFTLLAKVLAIISQTESFTTVGKLFVDASGSGGISLLGAGLMYRWGRIEGLEHSQKLFKKANYLVNECHKKGQNFHGISPIIKFSNFIYSNWMDADFIYFDMSILNLDEHILLHHFSKKCRTLMPGVYIAVFTYTIKPLKESQFQLLHNSEVDLGSDVILQIYLYKTILNSTEGRIKPVPFDSIIPKPIPTLEEILAEDERKKAIRKAKLEKKATMILNQSKSKLPPS